MDEITWVEVDEAQLDAPVTGYYRRDSEELVWRNHGSGGVRGYTRNGRFVRGYTRGQGPNQNPPKAGPGGKGGSSASGPASKKANPYKGLNDSERYAEKLRSGDRVTAAERKKFGDPSPSLTSAQKAANSQRFKELTRKTPDVKSFTVHQAGRTLKGTSENVRGTTDRVIRQARKGQLTPKDLKDWEKAVNDQNAAAKRALKLMESPTWRALPRGQQRRILREIKAQQRTMEKAQARLDWLVKNREALNKAARDGTSPPQVPSIFLNV